MRYLKLFLLLIGFVFISCKEDKSKVVSNDLVSDKECIQFLNEVLSDTVNFNKDNKITVDGNDVSREEFINFIREFADFTSDGKITMLHLNFDNRLTYDQYIQNKILAWKATNNEIQLSSFEFVYDEKKLPECGCKL